MRTIAHLTVVIAAAASSFGCASRAIWTDPSPGQASEALVDASPREVWAVLPEVHARLALGGEAESHRESPLLLASSQRVTVEPRDAPFGRCAVSSSLRRTEDGERPRFSSAHGFAEMELQTRLTEADDGTLVQVEVVFSASSGASDATGQDALCITTGRLEDQVIRGIRGLTGPPDAIPASAAGEREPF